MTRRKSACLKWTLVLLVVMFCPYVYTRPQDSSTSSVNTEITTESSIRYRYNNDSLRFKSSKLPIVISFVQNFSSVDRNKFNLSLQNNGKVLNNLDIARPNKLTKSIDNRTSRLIKRVVIMDMSKNKINNNALKLKHTSKPSHKTTSSQTNHKKRRPEIKKVLTKWKDETKYEDLNFTYETTTSDEIDPTTIDSTEPEAYTSTESIKNEPLSKKRNPSKYYTSVHKPQTDYSEGTPNVYSTNVQIVDRYPLQSTFMYTQRPSPTPEITNVGYPQQWYQQNPQVYRKPTTQKPFPNYHNSVPNYYPPNFEVSTFPPTSAYTERIVIRPEDYSGSNVDCPTIYLTLNNTFEGHAKEACPDLNIAVNTNVLNKNNIIETEEEDDSDSLFPGSFDIPLGDDSSPDEENDYFESNEDQEQEESASVEGSELSNYNAANAIQSESFEQGGLFSPSSPISALSRPGRPNKDKDDFFSFSALVEFFRPAISALGWLASINPLAIGLFPIFLAPIAFLFAGSGLAALFSPWFLPLGREAPKIIHVYRPYWHWDDTIKTWHLHSFPDNRNWTPSSRSSKEDDNKKSSGTPTLFRRLKDWMLSTTEFLRKKNQNGTVVASENRKSKRKKREVWSIRVK